MATRTQSLVGSPTRCVNTAECVQQRSRARQAAPVHGTGPESERSPSARCPLAALIWFWDCFIFLCQCDEGVGAAQSCWFNPVMENHLRERLRQILQAAAWGGSGEKRKQPPAQCEFTQCGSSAGKTIILNVWIREPDGQGNVNNSFLCGANAARRLTVQLNHQWVAYLLSGDSFTPDFPCFPLQHKQHTKRRRGVRKKTSLFVSCLFFTCYWMVLSCRMPSLPPTPVSLGSCKLRTPHSPTTGKPSHGPWRPSMYYDRAALKRNAAEQSEQERNALKLYSLFLFFEQQDKTDWESREGTKEAGQILLRGARWNQIVTQRIKLTPNMAQDRNLIKHDGISWSHLNFKACLLETQKKAK